MKFSNQNLKIEKEIKIPENLNAIKLSDGIPFRDPYIMLVNDKYFMYGKDRYDEEPTKIICYVSDDLENWSEPVTVYEPPKNWHGVKDLFWAPECHFYKGNFYIFTSVHSSKCDLHSISVYRADNPLGPFTEISDGGITPTDWDCIDGTLYIDKEQNPWMVFVHEWTSMPNKVGSMVAARLSEDFTHLITEPKDMFFADEPSWATFGVTDGPYMCETENGLYMTWSNFGKNNYVVAVSKSLDGTLFGKWQHLDTPLYERNARPEFDIDGGHGMIFADKEGNTKIVLHGPNNPKEDEYEHVMIFDIIEKDGTLKIK